MTRPIRTGDEQDALGRGRRFYYWRPGEVSRIKRNYRRKERREARSAIHRDGTFTDERED